MSWLSDLWRNITGRENNVVPIRGKKVEEKNRHGTFLADWKNPEWTDMLVASLEKEGAILLAQDFAGVYGDKKQFFVMLFSSLCRFEGNFNPEATYTEKFPDASGVRVVSRGLFQISIESANGLRYKCGLKKAEELHDPETNIRCAVKIATALIREDGILAGGKPDHWRGMARYWSPFRNPEKKAAIMANVKLALSAPSGEK